MAHRIIIKLFIVKLTHRVYAQTMVGVLDKHRGFLNGNLIGLILAQITRKVI
jgi:hypothetical protein